MERYFGFFADLIQEFPADVEEQDFYYGNTVELYDQICHGNGAVSYTHLTLPTKAFV